ncbi:transporter substrate-binding domain-containing protein [Mycobacterium kyogaense]|uniref:transporter substrate-binding domain-containing protein n=1 Tax=Mycobacterium kyogaense TaxID=2212479 RepID=UPI003FA5B424
MAWSIRHRVLGGPVTGPSKRSLVAVVAAALSMGLGACSSDDSSTAEPTGPAKVQPPAILQAGTLKICAPNDGTPPNVYHDESGELIGSEVDLGKALAAQMGLKPQFVESAFAAVIPTLQAKQCDVIMAQLYIKPEREAVVDFVPYVYSGTGIAVAKDKPADVTGLDDSLCRHKKGHGGRRDHGRVPGDGTVRQVHRRRQTRCRCQPQQSGRRVAAAAAERTGRRVHGHGRDARLLPDQDWRQDPDGRRTVRHDQDRRSHAQGRHGAARRHRFRARRTGEQRHLRQDPRRVGHVRPQHPEIASRNRLRCNSTGSSSGSRCSLPAMRFSTG